MSGGSFNYAYSRVEQFAEELRAKIADNGKENDYGEKREFSPETIALLQSIAEYSERTAKLMRAAELLYSGDTGEDSFSATVLGVCSELDAWRDRAALAGEQVRINETPEHIRRTGAPDRRRYDFLWWPAFRDRRRALAGRRVDDDRRAREFEIMVDSSKKESDK